MIKYKIITLCGSNAFADIFNKISEKLSLEGNVVLLPPSICRNANGHISFPITADIQNLINEEQKARIEISDEIFVINPKKSTKDINSGISVAEKE